MTVDQMIARLQRVRDDDNAMPLLTHEFAWLIGALRIGQKMRNAFVVGENHITVHRSQLSDAAAEYDRIIE